MYISKIKIFRWTCFGAVALLAGCGGGGGGSDNSSGGPLATGSAPALSSGDNSYRHFKQSGLAAQNLPVQGDARAYAAFSGGSGPDLFIASLNYAPSTSTQQTATPATFAIYRRQSNGSYTLDATLLGQTPGCIHPRKAVVADYNQDGRPDVFVACHGYDASPFPGEKNKLVLSQPNGSYQVSDASTDVGFFHSASAADLNGDGYPDIVLANNFDPRSVLVLLNQKNGNFQRETATRLPLILGGKNYFSIELADVDGDGKLDLLVGGHEWEGAVTRVFINPGNNVFEGVAPITIPAVPNEGVVLDFLVTTTGAQRDLWVLRTSGGDGTFYLGRTLQRVNLATLASTVPVNNRSAGWMRWIIPTTSGAQNLITTDDATDRFSYAY